MHIHPRVRIIVNGQDVPIPTNVGISAQGYQPIHTHDATGMLHIEAPIVRDFHLKDFFDTWGFVFSKQEVAGWYTNAAQPFTMTVNNQPSTAFGSLLLRDRDEIVLRATGAFPIANLSNIATSFTHSDENFRNFVTQAYSKYLGRSPDPQGLAGWVVRMRQGMTQEQIEANFIGSAEYIASHGGTGEAWVRGMYQDLLGRSPDPVGLQGWVARLNSGTKPYDVAYGFAASAEREGIRVREIYTTFLGRQPSQAEVDGWVTQFINGARQEAVVAGFLGSREYFNSSRKGNGDSATWLRSAYRDILRREAGTAEVTSWLEVLNRKP